MAEIVPPIIIDNHHPQEELTFFATVEALEGQLEPWYAEDEDFAAYDSAGRLLSLVVQDRAVVVRAAEDAPAHASDLGDALSAFIHEKTGVAPTHRELSILLEEGMLHGSIYR